MPDEIITPDDGHTIALDPPAPDDTPAGEVTTRQPTLYRVFIAQPTIERLLTYAAETDGAQWAGDPFPSSLTEFGDLAYVDPTIAGGDDARHMEGRLALVQAAQRDGVDLLFFVAPVSYLGEVPVETEVKRERRVGR